MDSSFSRDTELSGKARAIGDIGPPISIAATMRRRCRLMSMSRQRRLSTTPGSHMELNHPLRAMTAVLEIRIRIGQKRLDHPDNRNLGVCDRSGHVRNANVRNSQYCSHKRGRSTRTLGRSCTHSSGRTRSYLHNGRKGWNTPSNIVPGLPSPSRRVHQLQRPSSISVS